MSKRPFKIDGVDIPTPSKYKFGVEDLSTEKTGRTMDGVMHKDVIATKDYYECEWACLTWGDAAVLLNAIDGKTEVMFTHADPRVPDRWITSNYYVGKRSGGALNLKDDRNNWEGIALTFTKI